MEPLQSPIRIHELVNLTQVGISPRNINSDDLTMQSDKYICVREGAREKAQLVVLDMAKPTKPVRRPFDDEIHSQSHYDSVIMNPASRVLAHRVGRRLVILKLGTTLDIEVKSHEMGQDVLLWKWINNDKIGIVTADYVYHWSMEDGTKPIIVFDRYSEQGNNNHKDQPPNKKALISFMKDKQGFRDIFSFSSDRKTISVFDIDAAAFTTFKCEANSKPTALFCYAQGGTLHISDAWEPAEGDRPYGEKVVELFSQTREHVHIAADDNKFHCGIIINPPISIQISQKFKIIYIITDDGDLDLYDVESGDCIYQHDKSIGTPVITVPHEATSGIIVVNKEGQVLSISIDEEKIIHYVLLTSGNYELAKRLAIRWNVRGPARQFNAYFDNEQYVEAARFAATSLNGILRTPNTIKKLELVSTFENQTSPILHYFQILLDQGSLNEFESFELCKCVLEGPGRPGKELIGMLLNVSIGLCESFCIEEGPARKQLLKKWVKEDKLECSEELGDLVRRVNPTVALIVYLRSNCPNKVIQCLAEVDPLDELVLYGKKADYANLLPLVLPLNPEKGTLIAKMFVSEEGPLADINSIVDVFLDSKLEQPCASFLVDVLKRNLPEDGPLQTLCLELNLATAPEVADIILGDKIFTHYNRPHIAKLCEKAGLLQTALENYENVGDIKRLVVQTNLLNHERLIAFFGKLSDEDSLDCLHAMLSSNITQNLELSIQIATKYHDRFSSFDLIGIFEWYGGYNYFLRSIVKSSEDEEVHFRYIQAAYEAGELDKVERMCRESNHIDLERVKNYFKRVNLADQLPMFIVCGRIRELNAADPTT